MGGRYGRKGVPQEILDAMRDAMEQGQSMEQAAQEAGISMSTAKKYRDKGMLDVGQPGKHVKEIDLTHETQFRGGYQNGRYAGSGTQGREQAARM